MLIKAEYAKAAVIRGAIWKGIVAATDAYTKIGRITGYLERLSKYTTQIRTAITSSGSSEIETDGGTLISANSSGRSIPWHGKPNLPYHIQNPNLKPNTDAFNNIYNPMHNFFSKERNAIGNLKNIPEMYKSLSVDEQVNLKEKWKRLPNQFSPTPLIPFQPKRNGSSQNESNEGNKERNAFRKRHMKHAWFYYR